MINIVDNFLDDLTLFNTYNKLLENDFEEVVVGDKSFWVQFSNQEFDQAIINRVSSIEGVERESVFSFFRVATDELDTDWRIHADSIINGERPTRALVLNISPSKMTGLHGTAFWSHVDLGDSLHDGVSFEDFDGMLLNDSNDLSKWDLQSVVGYKINRAVCYPCNYFHSKYPNVGWAAGRMVYVMFYK